MLNTINEEIVHVNGVPQRLIIFLHGYIDNADYLNNTLKDFICRFDNTAIHLPQAPISCEVLEDKRQWYSMHRFDPNDERKTVATMDECVAIYDKMALGLEEARTYLDEYIDNCLNEYQLEDKNLYLCGFSQGAMLALYTALMRENKIGGVVSFSGILASHSFLQKHWHSTPDALLIHGNGDNLVRFEALDFTQKNLEKIGCNVETKVIENGQHRISEEGLAAAADFILGKKPARKKIAI